MRNSPTLGFVGYIDRLRSTATGRTLYQREGARFRELYPGVEASEPVQEAIACL